MRRYCTPLFQTQFTAFAGEPDKLRWITDAIDRFQKNMENKDFIANLPNRAQYPAMISGNEPLYELKAGENLRLVVRLGPRPSHPERGVFLFVGQPSLERTNPDGKTVSLQVEFERKR